MLKKIVFLFIVLNVATVHAKPMTVMLDWYLNPNHAPLLVGESLGFFKQHQLAIHMIVPADPMDPAKLVASGQVDLALTYPATFLLSLDQQLKVQRIGALIDQPLTCLLTKANGPIHDLKDLKHQTIAYTGGRAERAMLETVLQKNKLTLRDVTLINVHYNLLQALMSNKVTAAMGTFCNFEPLAMQNYGITPRSFNLVNYGVPSHEALIIISHLPSSNERLVRFVLALKDAVDYLKKHPERAWQAVIKNHPEFNTTLNHQAWLYTLPYFADDPSAFNPEHYARYATFLKEHNVISKITNNIFTSR